MHKGFVITNVITDANAVSISSVNDLELALENNKNIQIAGFYPGNRGMYYYGLNNVNTSSKEE